jgi:hypothetical protein
MDSEPLWLTRAWSQAGASARIGILALCTLLFASVADSRPVLAYAAVTPAGGGTRLVAGTPATLSGPYVTEAVPGGIGAGDITLQTPPGFEFDTSQYVTATVTNKGNCSPDEIANGANLAAPEQSASPSPRAAALGWRHRANCGARPGPDHGNSDAAELWRLCGEHRVVGHQHNSHGRRKRQHNQSPREQRDLGRHRRSYRLRAAIRHRPSATRGNRGS